MIEYYVPNEAKLWPLLKSNNFVPSALGSDSSILAHHSFDSIDEKLLVSYLNDLADHSRVIHKGEHLFRLDTPLYYLQLIRSGSCKHYMVDSDGVEHVTGFSFAGELLGLEAMYCGRYHQNAMALDTIGLCYISMVKLSHYCAKFPHLARLLLAALSQKLDQQLTVSFHFEAKKRVAQFLLLLSKKQRHIGLSARYLKLAMTREDIANYLCLRSETVSRIFTQFSKTGQIRVKRNDIELVDLALLNKIAGFSNRPTMV
jgi:CRP/FNR family transcriptional regulator, anaerobic regulatory protein